MRQGSGKNMIERNMHEQKVVGSRLAMFKKLNPESVSSTG
jgi:hypothetical protein